MSAVENKDKKESEGGFKTSRRVELPFLNNLIKVFRTPVGLFLGVFFGMILLITLLIKVTQGNGVVQTEAKNLLNQKEQSIGSDVHYTTEETLRTLTGETDNIQKGLLSMQSQMRQFKKTQSIKTQKAISNLQKDLSSVKAQNAQLETNLRKRHEAEGAKDTSSHGAPFSRVNSGGSADQEKLNSQSIYPVSNQGINPANSNALIWLSDQSTRKRNSPASIERRPLESGVQNAPPLGQDLVSNDQDAQSQKQNKLIPAFTIPANSILTDVTPLQPIVGMIPKNGAVVNAQSVMFSLSAHNLAANNWHLASALKGVQGNALCQGVFVWFNDSYANCAITSLTFIFNDGRVATETASSKSPFGHLTTSHGSPNIPGIYHGNALYAGSGTGFFSALQGFGNAYSASQQSLSSMGSQTVLSYKNAFRAGLGSGVGTAGQYMNGWWQRLLKSTTDFVFVPNWSPKTKQILSLNAVITRSVNINYNLDARKVRYDQISQNTFSNSLN